MFRSNKKLAITLVSVILIKFYYTTKYYLTFENLLIEDKWSDIYLFIGPAFFLLITCALVAYIIFIRERRIFFTLLQIDLMLSIVAILILLFLKGRFGSEDLIESVIILLYAYCIGLLNSFKLQHLR